MPMVLVQLEPVVALSAAKALTKVGLCDRKQPTRPNVEGQQERYPPTPWWLLEALLHRANVTRSVLVHRVFCAGKERGTCTKRRQAALAVLAACATRSLRLCDPCRVARVTDHWSPCTFFSNFSAAEFGPGHPVDSQ